MENLAVTFPQSKNPVLKGVSFEIKKGDFALIVGPTGVGKTTLLLTLAGVIPSLIPARVEGKVRLGNRNPIQEGLSGLAGFLGVVFQDPESQYIMPTVIEEAYFPAENLLLPRDEVARRAERALALVGLSEYKSHRVDTLSTGLKQRLALSTALVLDPEILLLDEPTAHIDMWTAREIYRVLGELKESGRTILVVEHRIELAENLADKVIYIEREGRASVYSSVEEMMRKRGAERLASEGIWVPTRYLRADLQKGNQENHPEAGQPEEVAVSAEDVTVKLGGVKILDNVTLSVRRGEVAVILGPNGSGKTTLLKVLSGILQVLQGRVRVLGGPPRPDKVAFVAQVPEFQFTERTVVEELASSFRARGFRREEALREARKLLRARGIEHLADRVVYELSQGEKRLVSLLEMDILEREVYLMDEPTFGLDLRYSLLVLNRVNELAKEGKAVVLVTHDSWALPLLRAKIYGFSRGKVVFNGSLQGLMCRRELWPELHFAPPKLVEDQLAPLSYVKTGGAAEGIAYG